MEDVKLEECAEIAAFKNLGAWFNKSDPDRWLTILNPMRKVPENYTKTEPLYDESGCLIKNQQYDDSQEKWVAL